MEYILWAIFSVICTAASFVVFHYDQGSPYRPSRGFEFDFNDVYDTSFKAFCALLLGIFVGGMMVLIWQFFAILFTLVAVAFGIAYGLKRFFAKKG